MLCYIHINIYTFQVLFCDYCRVLTIVPCAAQWVLLFILFFFFFFFSFLAPLRHMEFLGQGSDWSCSCNPSRSCGNARSSTHCAGQGIEPASQGSQDAADPVVPQWELLYLIYSSLHLPIPNSFSFLLFFFFCF